MRCVPALAGKPPVAPVKPTQLCKHFTTSLTSRGLPLLEEAGVATLAGTAFGAFGEGYLRLSYANSQDNIRKALDAIDAHIAKQTGWLRTVEAKLVAEDVKSVVEHTDIYRVFHVWVPGPGMPSASVDETQ